QRQRRFEPGSGRPLEDRCVQAAAAAGRGDENNRQQVLMTADQASSSLTSDLVANMPAPIRRACFVANRLLSERAPGSSVARQLLRQHLGAGLWKKSEIT